MNKKYSLLQHELGGEQLLFEIISEMSKRYLVKQPYIVRKGFDGRRIIKYSEQIKKFVSTAK